MNYFRNETWNKDLKQNHLDFDVDLVDMGNKDKLS